MSENNEKPPIDHTIHRRLAVDLFNDTWTLMEKTDRSPAETDRMIHTAHASRYHWGIVGDPVNLARGEWQVSRMYAILGRSEPCLYHARRCLEICEENGIGDWDIAFAHEAVARGYAAAGDRAACERHRVRAFELGEAITDPEDRDLLLKDLQAAPWFGMIDA